MKRATVYFLVAAVLTCGQAFAAGHKPASISVGYFLHWPTPSQFSQLKKTYDFALGVDVNWVSFASGTDMNRALAAGEIQVAYAQGHVPFVVAVTNGLELTMIGIAVTYPENDNCILRDDAGITRATARQLEGRKVATQVGGVTHFKLLQVLDHLGVDASRVEIMSVENGAEAAAALQRGDVVMACAFGNSLRRMSAIGQPLLSGAEQEAIGLKLFDVISVPTAFMDEHPEIVQAFMDVTEATNSQWRQNPDPMRAAIARAADMDPISANRTLDRFSFPSAAEQKSTDWMDQQVADYSKSLADFFVEHGRMKKALDSYDAHITTRFLR